MCLGVGGRPVGDQLASLFSAHGVVIVVVGVVVKVLRRLAFADYWGWQRTHASVWDRRFFFPSFLLSRLLLSLALL